MTGQSQEAFAILSSVGGKLGGTRNTPAQQKAPPLLMRSRGCFTGRENRVPRFLVHAVLKKCTSITKPKTM